MGDRLSKQARDAIAAYRGRVTICSRGERVYDAADPQNWLREQEGRRKADARAKRFARAAANAKTQKAARNANRERYAELFRAGLPINEIARRMETSRTNAQRMLIRMGLIRSTHSEEQIREVAALRAKGLTQSEVAKRLGVHRTTVAVMDDQKHFVGAE